MIEFCLAGPTTKRPKCKPRVKHIGEVCDEAMVQAVLRDPASKSGMYVIHKLLPDFPQSFASRVIVGGNPQDSIFSFGNDWSMGYEDGLTSWFNNLQMKVPAYF